MFSFPQLERQGFLLVEFEAPLAAGPELPAQRQRVVLEEDVIQFSPTMEYSLRPGDKVLAPWGPDQQRYGPGTVLLGLEARDPQRGKGAALGLPRSKAGDQAELPAHKQACRPCSMAWHVSSRAV